MPSSCSEKSQPYTVGYGTIRAPQTAVQDWEFPRDPDSKVVTARVNRLLFWLVVAVCCVPYLTFALAVCISKILGTRHY